jgi:hypothetical protein
MNKELELLIEAVASTWRERDAGGRAVPPPAFYDLSPDARVLAFDRQSLTRQLERALDEAGFSGTVRAVLSRLPRI